MHKQFATFEPEKKFAFSQIGRILGIDEVGRGPIAGPLTVAGVVLGNQFDWMLLGICDSKLCTKKQLQTLSVQIKENAVKSTFCHVSVERINKHGIVNAFKFGVETVVTNILKSVPNMFEHVLIDGTSYTFKIQKPYSCIPKGDLRCISIAAASIIAKVERDAYMDTVSKNYPLYEWKKNKGYGTKTHKEAIKSFGITRYHRLQFTRTFLSS